MLQKQHESGLDPTPKGVEPSLVARPEICFVQKFHRFTSPEGVSEDDGLNEDGSHPDLPVSFSEEKAAPEELTRM